MTSKVLWPGIERTMAATLDKYRDDRIMREKTIPYEGRDEQGDDE